MKKTTEPLTELIGVIRKLRGPRGCPWDRKQTPADLKIYLTEELYELLEAIDLDRHDLLAEEIGDFLFMILFLVTLYEEKQAFSLADTLGRIRDKMIHRHPHVFGGTRVDSAEQVKENWQALKEKEGKKPKKSLLDGFPTNLPALTRAFLLTRKAAEVGFDWPDAAAVLQKVKEETGEAEEALAGGQTQKVTEEIGDLLFSLVNLSRHLGTEPEQALRRANEKFIRRFEHVESRLKQQGIGLKQASLEEMDRLWEEAKNER